MCCSINNVELILSFSNTSFSFALPAVSPAVRMAMERSPMGFRLPGASTIAVTSSPFSSYVRCVSVLPPCTLSTTLSIGSWWLMRPQSRLPIALVFSADHDSGSSPASMPACHHHDEEEARHPPLWQYVERLCMERVDAALAQALITRCTALRSLSMIGCDVSQLIHHRLHELSTLAELRLRRCRTDAMFSIPTSVLRLLQRLELSDEAVLANPDLKWLSNCINVSELCLTSSYDEAVSYNSIAMLHKTLRKLSLSNTAVRDVGWLPTCAASLVQLDLSGCQRVVDFRPIGELFMLQRLDVSRSKVDDLSWVSSLATLEVLIASDCFDVSDFTPLAALSSSLKVLDIGGADITDISWIAGCAALEEVRLSRSWRIADFSAIGQLKQLRILDLFATRVKDISWLSALPSPSHAHGLRAHLRVLDLRLCWTLEDLSPISFLSALTTLHVSISDPSQMDWACRGGTSSAATRILITFKDTSLTAAMSELEEKLPRATVIREL